MARRHLSRIYSVMEVIAMLLHFGAWPLVCGLDVGFGCGLGKERRAGVVEVLLCRYVYMM